ncbi:LysE family transporter [Staphylococcus succinus]|uniref:LysE/ArgO family amino acid transporter n=1 Tax=Staphylococcus TaxID=1279 RepID=UPI00062B49F6|nr:MULTISPECIES: LysE family transporter [Staphylococcus]MDH9162247.1 LysE family transporter [Staphylococcus succinus]MEB8125147.1 LysE family transporter [Staphylococcus succinus]OIJ30083.1 lysine transporter LysE [Staphylococcus sp. LCT-H4]PNZ23566.1 lysine transporter LysE [Staphylococcus succinus subsp. succinus]
MLQPLIHGFLLALGLILPLGAQNVFVFNQGANYKSIFKVLPVIITAGVCDSLLIILAVLGVSVILLSFPILQVTIYCIGLLFLLYMAWSMWMAKPERVNTTRPMSTKKQITFALSVSLLNPHAIMDTIGVIGTNGAIYEGVSKGIFMIATLSVSWLWFFLLAILGKALGHMDTSGKYIIMINKISVVIILVVFGIIFKQLMMIVC